ncbi:hypothetical protein ACJA25_03425 [Mycoplasmopsis hyopharyngis]|uniref:hypothetical protein n=1 Tax=Mycoplasmopsis hyopharyngis TaxID=29558 RepID=UPI003872E383
MNQQEEKNEQINQPVEEQQEVKEVKETKTNDFVNEVIEASEEKNPIVAELEKKNNEDKEKLAKMNKNELWYNHIKINKEYYYRRANSNINMAFMVNIFTIAVVIFVIIQLSTKWNELKSSGNKLVSLFIFSSAMILFSGFFLYNGIINVYLLLATKKFMRKDPNNEDTEINDQFDQEIMKLVKKYVKFSFKRKPIFQSII